MKTTIREELGQAKRRLIRKAIDEVANRQGNVQDLAEALGVSEITARRYLAEAGVETRCVIYLPSRDDQAAAV